MLNMSQISSLMAAAEGPVAEFSSFANFEEKNGFFWPNKKKFVFLLLSADSRYFRIYALKWFLRFLESLCTAVRYLFVTQCGRSILGGRGRAISILIRNHLEHTILLSKKRINKRKERMTCVPLSRELSPVVVSYATSYLHCVTLCP